MIRFYNCFILRLIILIDQILLVYKINQLFYVKSTHYPSNNCYENFIKCTVYEIRFSDIYRTEEGKHHRLPFLYDKLRKTVV